MSSHEKAFSVPLGVYSVEIFCLGNHTWSSYQDYIVPGQELYLYLLGRGEVAVEGKIAQFHTENHQVPAEVNQIRLKPEV